MDAKGAKALVERLALQQRRLEEAQLTKSAAPKDQPTAPAAARIDEAA
jgi:hypothetical protein